MKSILLVEDDEPKLQQILSYLATSFATAKITVARSLNAASKKIDVSDFDVVLLDMSLPTFDGGKTANAAGRQKTFGGRELLMYIWELEKEVPVFVVTQFRDFPGDEGAIDITTLDKELRLEFPTLYVDYVYFEHNSDAWKSKLSKLLNLKC